MEPIGLCGGGLVALLIFLILIVGAAVLAGGIVLTLAKIGMAVDARLKPHSRATDEPPKRDADA